MTEASIQDRRPLSARVPVTVLLAREQRQELVAIARSEDRSVSSLVRRVLHDYVNSEKEN